MDLRDSEGKALEFGSVAPADTQLLAKLTTCHYPPQDSFVFLLELRSFHRFLCAAKISSIKLTVEVKEKPAKIATLKKAFAPESLVGKKCQMRIKDSSMKDRFQINFTSTDIVSMRASFNTNLRLLNAALKAMEPISHSHVIS